MFSKFRKYMVLAVVSVASLAIVGQAAATTVTVSPGGAVTGTAGTSQLVLNTARRTLNCTSTSATATTASAVNVSTNLNPIFSGCRIVGGVNITATCGSASTLTVTGLTSGGVTPGQITGIACTISVNATCSVRVNGSVRGSFNNSGSILTVAVAGQSLQATGSTCSLLPNDSSATFSNGSGLDLPYTISPTTTVNAV